MPYVKPDNCENHTPVIKTCNLCDTEPINVINKEESVQKKIWNVCRVPSSLYTMNLSAQTVNHNKQDIGVGKKHGSYDRYLARKKAPHLYSTDPYFGEIPKQGNKKYVLGFIDDCYCKNTSIN